MVNPSELAVTTHWAPYLCSVNGKLASMLVDLNWASRQPVCGKDRLCWVFVTMRTPRADGLSDGAEAPVLYEIEDALVAKLSECCGAVLPGRITTDNRREFYFYAEKTDGFADVVVQVLAAFPAYTYESGQKSDPAWTQYRDVLYPSDTQLQCILNAELLDVLARDGDIHELSRPVDHTLNFLNPLARRRFLEQSRAVGFRATRQSPLWKARPFSLTISKEQPIHQPEIDRTVLQLLELAAKHKGTYDGWGTVVMKG